MGVTGEHLFSGLLDEVPGIDGIIEATNLAMGKADWLWDDDLGVHVPCCTSYVEIKFETELNKLMTVKCGNGPLVGSQIKTGRCSTHSLGTGD